MSSTLSSFAENGYRVFLLNHMEKNQFTGELSCGCGNPKCAAVGKHPTNEAWQRTHEWDSEQIANFQMFVDDMGRGYGVLCNNLLVIDVDARNGGVESYQKLVEDFPEIIGCGLIVETGSGSGSRHLYFKLSPDEKISQKHGSYPGIDFKHGPGFVVGPGSPHASGKSYKVKSGSVEDIDAPPAALVAALKRKPAMRVEFEGHNLTLSEYTLKTLVEALPAASGTSYDEWVKIGMALHHATDGDGQKLWDEWSRPDPRYDAEVIDMKWHSFKGSNANPVTVASLIHLAKQNGWVEPISDEPEPELQGWFAKAVTGNPVTSSVTKDEINAKPSMLKNCPVDVSCIDLKKPPGFVGEVTEWINNQCKHPRENLAPMAALFAIGNAAGLHYKADDEYETRSNLAVFCVAGSGTGKDSILSATKEIIRVAGLTPAMYGGIKSDREFVLNLMEHQAAIYVMDEIGSRLEKISNSGKNGASHLDGVMASFMDYYTKSSGDIIVDGDKKKDADKFLRDRRSELEKRIENNEDKNGSAEAELESIKIRIAADGKIDKPFLSMIGFTTPRQFSAMMTIDNTQTGFLGRTILCTEPDINPFPKRPFKKQPMPNGMKMKIMQLANASPNYEGFRRVETKGNVHSIGHTKEAVELLEKCDLWIWGCTQAQVELGNDVFVPLYRRAFEKAVKIALVLGVADGEIDVEHVEWAMAASMKDVEEIISAVKIEDQSFSKGDRLAAALLGALKSKPGQTLAQIHNRSNINLKYQKEDVGKMLERLEKTGQIRIEESADKRSGSPLLKYYLKG